MSESSEDPGLSERPEYAPPADGILEALISVVDRAGLNIQLTLTTPGGIVTGEAIGRVTWIRALASSLSQQPGGAAHDIAQAFENVATAWEPEAEKDGPGPYYVHLRDAQHLVGGVLVPAGGSLWRGRLGEISGWFLGRLRTN